MLHFPRPPASHLASAACRKRSFYDQEARTLRGQLRAAYESLLFLDAAFAAANDVELLLWKSVFYRPIEEFRARMKQTEQVGNRLEAAAWDWDCSWCSDGGLLLWCS
jgi:hypothetical protein